jgi:hypothetical protein
VSSLSEEKLKLLYSKIRGLLSNQILLPPTPGEKEPNYTQRVILPLVSEWVKSLNENGLHVRGDGGPNPLPIVWDEISLYPDVKIMNFHDRLVAIEVKFLKQEDAGGSLTKGIGQTVMYEKAGFSTSVGMMIDCRQVEDWHVGYQISQEIVISEHSSALIYKPIAKVPQES